MRRPSLEPQSKIYTNLRIIHIRKNQIGIVVKAVSNKDIVLIEEEDSVGNVMVKGTALGRTTLIATAVYGSKNRVKSKESAIHVFPPLTLEPRNVTLIIGAQFQVQVLGGPSHLNSNVEFSIANGKIANLDNSGLISALTLGSSKIMTTAVVTDDATGKKIILSSDIINLHVVKLQGVITNAGLFFGHYFGN